MFIIFISIFTLVLLLLHWLVAFFLIRLLGLSKSAGRKMHLIFVLLLANFLFSNIILAAKVNWFTKLYYTLSGLWLGIFANLVISLILGWLVFLIARALKKKIKDYILRWLVFGGAIALSLFGIWQAWNPTVVSYEVYIKDLPYFWEGKRIIHITDLHLGPVYGSNFFKQIVRKVGDLQPDTILITGDLFDGREMDFSWVGEEFKILNVPQGIYYSLGNHDLSLGMEESNWNKDGLVKLLSNQIVEVEELQVIGLDYGREIKGDVLTSIGYDSNKPAVLLFHEPKEADFFRSSGIDLQLAGHTHNGQIFPFNFLVKSVYKGFNRGLFVDNDFSLLTSSGLGTWGPSMRTSSRSEIVNIILKSK